MDENGISERELIISCIERKSNSENLNIGRRSDVSIGEKKENWESLQEAFKDAEMGKNGFVIVDILLYHRESVLVYQVMQLVVIRLGEWKF